MMYREFWEEHYGDENKCRVLAERLTGLDLSAHQIMRGLTYMIELQSADRFSGFSDRPGTPSWRQRNSPDYCYGDWWEYRITTCLNFKPTDNYMTSEGWPLGTECWYSTIELGWRTHTCSETAEMAIYRALILSHTALQHRAMHPKTRPGIEEMMAQIASAG